MTYPPLGGVAITIFLDIFGLLALVTCTLSPINLIFSVQKKTKNQNKTSKKPKTKINTSKTKTKIKNNSPPFYRRTSDY